MKGFNNLELFFKKNFVRKNTKFLIATPYLHYTASLYAWNKFLIEQYYDNKQGEVTVITLARHKDLKKYIDKIDLSDLGFDTRL